MFLKPPINISNPAAFIKIAGDPSLLPPGAIFCVKSHLPAARRGYHGLYLEMKSEEGIATKEQKASLRGVLEEDYCAAIVEGVDAARETLRWYIGISDHEPASVIKTAQICQALKRGE
jgi:hypothetical protein